MERLKRYLADKKLTQLEFAKRVGVSQATVSDWLSGEMKPSAEKLLEIATETGLSIDMLLGHSVRRKRATPALSA